jgi:hypothetical protein
MARPIAVLVTTATSIAAASTVARMSFRNLNGSPLRRFVPPQRLQIAICVDSTSMIRSTARKGYRRAAGSELCRRPPKQNMIRGATI